MKLRHDKMPTSETAKNRLLRFCIIPEDPDKCWGWAAAKKATGYGRIRIDYQEYIASRLSYAVHHGDPGPLDVLHTCDTPECCNPRHLRLGTHEDNMRDAVTKGRWVGKGKGKSRNRGADHPMSTLDKDGREDAIRMIFEGVPHKAIAAKVGTSLSAIRCMSMREKRKAAGSLEFGEPSLVQRTRGKTPK